MRVSLLVLLALVAACFLATLTVADHAGDALAAEAEAEWLDAEMVEVSAEAEVDAGADMEAEAEAQVEADLEVEASCPGLCQSSSTACSGNAWMKGVCPGSLVCCTTARATPAATPAARPGTPAAAPAAAAASGFGATAVQRASTWVAAKLQYCQAPNGGADASGECPRTCRRQSNAAWDRYRSDCSGLVSYGWGLPAPGETTRSLMNVANVIQCSTLRPGDAINIPGRHTLLFVKWLKPQAQALFYEEPGCSSLTPYAKETIHEVTCRGTQIQIRQRLFTTIRKKGQ